MQELNTFEIAEVSGSGPIAVAGAIIVIGVAALVAIGFADGWKEEAKKDDQNKKKQK